MLRTLAATVATFCATSVAASGIGPYSDLIVFGDSLSDPGNIFALTSDNPFLPTSPDPDLYPLEQFTNGDTWATQLGADFESGTNFAFGGARARENFDVIPDFGVQRALFRGATAIGEVDLGDNPLTAVLLGGNDLRDYAETEDAAIITSAVDAIVSGLRDLIDFGLSDFLVIGLPDVGKTPESTAEGNSTEATLGSLLFNGLLLERLGELSADANVEYFDTFSFFTEVYNDFEEFGFKNRVDACIFVDDCSLANANDYLFYDGVHPTDAFHSLFASAIEAQIVGVTPVPLPASGLLMIAGFALLGARRSRRGVSAS